VDLGDTFDTIDHILLQREHVIGIFKNTLDWFKSYLSCRFPFVDINKESFSYNCNIHGSVLGSVFFTLQMLL